MRAAGEPSWVKIASENFELLTTAGERAGRNTIRRFEEVRSFFVQAAGTRASITVRQPVRIIVFRSEKEFRPYQPSEVAAAYYLAGAACDYIVMGTAGQGVSPVTVHEYTHLLTKYAGGDLALWLNEGLAELYSNMQPVGSKIAVGIPLDVHRFVLMREKWIPLEELTTAGRDSPLYNEKARAGVFYAESWALAHMLSLQAQYRAGYSAFLGELGAGTTTRDAFRKIYNKSLSEVQADLDSYIRGRWFSASLHEVKLPKKTEQPDVQPATALEVGLALADILAGQKGKVAQAQEAFEELASQFPKSWEAQHGLAQLSWRNGKVDQAIDHFRLATELGSSNAKMHFDYGMLLAERGHRTEAITVLQRAAGLNPTDRLTHLNLGFLLVQDGSYGEALTEFRATKTVRPDEAYRFFFAAAYAHYRLGEKMQARTAAESGLKYAKTQEERASVQQLVAALVEDRPTAPARSALERATVSEPVFGSEGRPRLERAPMQPESEKKTAETAAVTSDWPVVDGTLEAVECLGKTARLRVLAGGRPLAFDVTDPERVQIRSGSGAAVEFSCGRQGGKQIRIEYEPKPGGPSQGVVRALEFP